MVGEVLPSGATQARVLPVLGCSTVSTSAIDKAWQATRFESGADTRLSTVARYAAALGLKLTWSLEAPPDKKGTSARPAKAKRGAASEAAG